MRETSIAAALKSSKTESLAAIRLNGSVLRSVSWRRRGCQTLSRSILPSRPRRKKSRDCEMRGSNVARGANKTESDESRGRTTRLNCRDSASVGGNVQNARENHLRSSPLLMQALPLFGGIPRQYSYEEQSRPNCQLNSRCQR